VFFAGFALFRRYMLHLGVAFVMPEYLLTANLDTLSMGALLAIFARSRYATEATQKLAMRLLPFAVIICVAWYWFNGGFGVFFPSVFALSGVVLLWAAMSGKGWLCSALRFRPLTYLGKISYGIYLYHFIIIVFLQHYLNAFWLAVVTVGVASLSWYFIEAPILRLKKKYAP